MSSEKDKIINLLKRQLNIFHTIDKYRDEDEQKDLKILLVRCMKFLARELDVYSAFVSYYDPYNKNVSVSVGADGLMRREDNEVVNNIFTTLENTRSPLDIDTRIFGSHFYAIPLILHDEYIGALGVNLGTSEDIDSDDCNTISTLITEASLLIDSMILKYKNEKIKNDELYLVDALDQVIDEGNFSHTDNLKTLLDTIGKTIDSCASYIFEYETTDWRPLAIDSGGNILWETNPALRHITKLLVQESESNEKQVIRSFDDQDGHIHGGKPIKSIIVYPLKTNTGEIAGSLVFFSNENISRGHIELIKRAASTLDTIILGRHKTEIMIKRYNKYLGSENLNILLKTPEWLDPRVEEVVILSVDLTGSTEYAHTENNKYKVFEEINSYLTLLGHILKHQYNGTLDKYIGDEVMGVFGAPVPDKNKAVNAIECALTMIKEVSALNDQREKDNKPCFEVKVALGLVQCIAGEVGGVETQADYTVIGREVNQVFRIAKYAVTNSIVVNSALYTATKDKYDFTLYRNVDVKGVPMPLSIYELNNKKSS